MKNVYRDSIVLIGPVGAGKSLLADEISARAGLPVVSSDKLRHLMGLSQIKALDFSNLDEKQQKEFCNIAKLWETLLSVGFNEKELSNFYSKHGFDKNISQEIERKYGPIGWHCYQKQFEIELLKYISSNLNQPVILDLGAGMAISLDKDYERIKKRMRVEDRALYDHCFQCSFSFKDIRKALNKFDNVIYLQLPKDYKTKMEKASKDRLNEVFLSTKQYDQLSTKTANVDGLIDGNKKNKERAEIVVDKILKEKQKS